jgi:thiamine pyrophosphokinase
MPEQRIVVEIDDSGKINAETFGIKGEVCVDKLQEILGDVVGDIDSVSKKDEYYQKVNQNVQNKQKAGLR